MIGLKNLKLDKELMRLDYEERIKSLVPRPLQEIIESVSILCAELGYLPFIAGGGVRDLLLQKQVEDLDIVIVGDAIKVADQVAQRKGYMVVRHPEFRTATLSIETLRADIVTARAEIYPAPAALPKITPSDIRDDMFRRDFTINSMALALSGYRLLDFFGGSKDLKDGIIRVLHSRSFIDDPTRIFRCIRFEARYGFSIDDTTSKLINEAVEQNVPRLLSNDRIAKELDLMFSEQDFYKMLCRMFECGIWQLLFGDGHTDINRFAMLKKNAGIKMPKLWLVLALYEASQSGRLAEVLKRYRRYLLLMTEMRNMEKMPDFDAINGMLDNQRLYRLYSNIPTEVLEYALAFATSTVYSDNLRRYLDMVSGFRFFIGGNDLVEIGLKPGPLFGILLEQAKAEISQKRITDREEQKKILMRIAGRLFD